MNDERLLHLAGFLEALPEKKFYYGAVVNGEDVPRKTFDCGSTACAVGWCPIAFPEHFKYLERFMDEDLQIEVFAMMDGRTYGTAIRVYAYQRNNELEEFFGIDNPEVLGLFYPGKQDLIGEPSLTGDASAKEVASMIRRFVKMKQAA